MLKLSSQRKKNFEKSLATLSLNSQKELTYTVPLNIWLGTFFGPLVNPILDCRKRVEPSPQKYLMSAECKKYNYINFRIDFFRFG